MLGFFEVNSCTFKSERRSHFHDNHCSIKSCLKTAFVITPILYFTSMIVLLRGQNDMDAYCQEGSDKCIRYTALQAANYNYFAFALPYLLGLQFTYLDRGEL